MPRTPPFSRPDACAAIAGSSSWAGALRLLGYEPKGCNYRTLQRWAAYWAIPIDHFDPNAGRRAAVAGRATPLEQVLVRDSPYPRWHLKRRLFASGLKTAACEMCGQGEVWRGRQMSLVLDHINGISNDNRLENLRIVCPNCAATLDTHCGRNLPRQRVCPSCNRRFAPTHVRHRYCSQRCWGSAAALLYRGASHPETRKVDRPALEQLRADLESMSYVAVGRKYGVSDNGVRKWLRWYEQQASNGGAGRQTDRPGSRPP